MELHQVDLLEHNHVYIIPMSDFHVGDPRFDEKKLLGYIKWVQETPNAYVILVGDLMNTAIMGSVSDTYEETMTPNEQLKRVKQLLTPIKDRILAACDGNHERRITKQTSINITELLAEYLDCYYRPYGYLLKLRVGKRSTNAKPSVYTLYATHGHGGGGTPGGKINMLTKMAKVVLADIYVAGHCHLMAPFQKVYHMPDTRNNTVTLAKQTFVASGSYLGWGGYSEQGILEPSKLGSPRIRLEGKAPDVHVSI